MIATDEYGKLAPNQQQLAAIVLNPSTLIVGDRLERVVVDKAAKMLRCCSIIEPVARHGSFGIGSGPALPYSSVGQSRSTFDISISTCGIVRCRRFAVWHFSAWIGGQRNHPRAAEGEPCCEIWTYTKEGRVTVRLQNSITVFWSVYPKLRDAALPMDQWESRVTTVHKAFPYLEKTLLKKIVKTAIKRQHDTYGYNEEFRRFNALNKAIDEVVKDTELRIPFESIWLLVHDAEGTQEVLSNVSESCLLRSDSPVNLIKTEEIHTQPYLCVKKASVTSGNVPMAQLRKIEPELTLDTLRLRCDQALSRYWHDAPSEELMLLLLVIERRPKTKAAVVKQLRGYGTRFTIIE